MAATTSDIHSTDDGAASRFSMRRLDRPHVTARRIDGGWWPRSTVLENEIAQVVRAAAGAGFATRRLTYCIGAWPGAPRRVLVDGVKIKLGGFRTQPADTVTLVDGSGWGRLELVVVPPDTSADAAALALSDAAAEHGGHDPGDEVLARASAAVRRDT